MTSGYSVQVAHRVGAKDNEGARRVLRQGITASLTFSILTALIGVAISGHPAQGFREAQARAGIVDAHVAVARIHRAGIYMYFPILSEQLIEVVGAYAQRAYVNPCKIC